VKGKARRADFAVAAIAPATDSAMMSLSKRVTCMKPLSPIVQAGSLRILSVRQQFLADHSSTNYFFYAAKPLSQKVQEYVNTLSSHVAVGDRTAEITYNGEFADLGDERRKKFLAHFDVEVRESYDWWTLSVMLAPEKLGGLNLEDYEAEGEACLVFERHDKQVRLRFDGWHQHGSRSMAGLAELGLKLRAELYAGKPAALLVMRQYCAENEILKKPESPVAKKLAALLMVM
jgi:hypothetical protein